MLQDVTVIEIGQNLAGPFAGWRAAILTPDAEAARRLRRPAKAQFSVKNGGLGLRWVIC